MKKTYQKSPIIEAVCEFRFDLKNPLTVADCKLFHEEIKADFPQTKKAQVKTVQFVYNSKEKSEIVNHGIASEFDQYLSGDNKTLVQLDNSRLSIHKLKPYLSWNDFLPKIKLCLKVYLKLASVSQVNRIGLRYINNFEVPGVELNTENYFHFKLAIPGMIKDKESIKSYFVGTLLETENGRDGIKIQLGDRQNPASDKAQLILDLEYFLKTPASIKIEEIEPWLEKGHEHLENIFEATLTDKAKSLFD